MKKLIIILVALAFISTATAQNKYKIIVNNSNSVSALSKADISKYFLKKITSWSNGSEIMPVDQTDNNSVREDFSQDIHGKSVAAIKSYWQVKIFSGRAVPPPMAGSDKDVIEFVRSNPAAIGYVKAGVSTSGVKVIDVTD